MAYELKAFRLNYQKYTATVKQRYASARLLIGAKNLQLGLFIVLIVTLFTLCFSIFFSIQKANSKKNRGTPSAGPETPVLVHLEGLISEPSHPDQTTLAVPATRARDELNDAQKTILTLQGKDNLKETKKYFENQTITPDLIASAYANSTDPLHLSQLDALVVSYAELGSSEYRQSLENISNNITHGDPEVRLSALKSYIDYGLEYSQQKSLEFIYQTYTQETSDQVKKMLLQELAFSGDEKAIQFVEHQAENPNNSEDLQEASWIALANSAQDEDDLE